MFKFYVKYCMYKILSYYAHDKIIEKEHESTAIVFGCPNYGNIGDIAIEKAEVEMLNKKYKIVKTIPVGDAWKYLKNIKKCTLDDDAICIMGGGNFGGLYTQMDLDRLLLFKAIKRRKIISFPQSIFYTKDGFRRLYRGVLKNRDNVFLFFRERRSYDIALNDFSFMRNRVFLVPDIVLSLKREYVKNRRKGYILAFRKDKEKAVCDDDIHMISGILGEKETIKMIDTAVTLKDVNRKYNELDALLLEYSKSRMIVTDRLHGMILAYITNTPCIAIANNNGKVKSEYETWLKKCPFILFLDKITYDDVRRMVDYLNSSLDDSAFSYDVKDKFATLRDKL